MKMHLIVSALVASCALPALADEIKVRVRKDAIIVSPMDPGGNVTVTGPPGCVMGMFPIQITATNKETDIAVRGTVGPDGSFAVRLPAGPRDSIKLVFLGANGKKKSVKVKVPKAVLAVGPPPVERRIERATVTVPGGSHGAGEPEAAAPGAPDMIRQEKSLKASGVIE